MTERPRPTPQNPLHERYASDEMAALLSAEHRYTTWRRVWITLAECQRDLGLEIRGAQIEALRRVAGQIDLARVAEIERETRHDVVAHLRHFAELAGEAGGILHLGATSAFVTDNTDALLLREGLELIERRIATVLRGLSDFAAAHRALPCLAYTHFQPAQLTTVGKRACLWAQDLLADLEEVAHRRQRLRCRGAKGTTGTQASFLTLFGGDHDKVRELDRSVAERLGFPASWPITGQTYPRKQDTVVLQALAGVGESCHKMGTDLRLLQGVGELSEPFGDAQVGSSAMAYKRNPIRAERICGLSRRLITDALNGPLNSATQWLERSLDDSSNRRLVITDAFLTCDAVLTLAAGVASGLVVRPEAIEARVRRELPFMATETFLMEGTMRGGDRQLLHEVIREYSMKAHAAVSAGLENPLLDAIKQDGRFGLSAGDVDRLVDPVAFTGRSAEQVDEFLAEQLRPAISGHQPLETEEPRV
ncbi:MAG: adenylosuccinate lyase [Acidobacteria bacterium]|nr:MAG: adenylosuccinate lyase [Acidobacteriota bacterium]REK10682.1 MAG: adenylosuccinate lyase [Acidobacteriota bacterium]